jgi:hypothetical protein
LEVNKFVFAPPRTASLDVHLTFSTATGIIKGYVPLSSDSEDGCRSLLWNYLYDMRRLSPRVIEFKSFEVHSL